MSFPHLWPLQKPRIYRRFGVWVCVGKWCEEAGKTPREAFVRWDCLAKKVGK